MKESHASSRTKSALGGKKSKSSGSKPHSMHIKRGHKGGFIAVHHAKTSPGEMPEEDQEHPIPDMASLQSHIQDNMGDQPPAPVAAPPAAMPQAGPAAGPAPTM